MKKLLLLLFCAFFIQFWPGSAAYALEFKVGPYFTEFKDVTAYHRNFGKDEVSRMATGLAGSTLAKLSHKDVWIADVFTPYVMGGTTVSGQANPTAIFGAEIINLMGLRFGVDYNTEDAKWGMVFGVSLTGLAQQFTKRP